MINNCKYRKQNTYYAVVLIKFVGLLRFHSFQILTVKMLSRSFSEWIQSPRQLFNSRRKRPIGEVEEDPEEQNQKKYKPIPPCKKCQAGLPAHNTHQPVHVQPTASSQIFSDLSCSPDQFSLFCVEFHILYNLAGFVQFSRRSCVYSIQIKAHASMLSKSSVFVFEYFDIFYVFRVETFTFSTCLRTPPHHPLLRCLILSQILQTPG